MVQIVAGTTPEKYWYNSEFLSCFWSLRGNLSKTQPTNNPRATVIAVALT